MLFRRLALISILLLTCGPAMAERPPLPDPPRIDVPETFPPHPRLFINQKEIDALKAWAKRDKVVGDYVERFITRSLAEIDTITLPGPKSGDHNTAIAGKAQLKML